MPNFEAGKGNYYSARVCGARWIDPVDVQGIPTCRLQVECEVFDKGGESQRMAGIIWVRAEDFPVEEGGILASRLAAVGYDGELTPEGVAEIGTATELPQGHGCNVRLRLYNGQWQVDRFYESTSRPTTVQSAADVLSVLMGGAPDAAPPPKEKPPF